MQDRDSRSTRLRYTAAGALAALAVVGGVAGTAALADKPPAKATAYVPTKAPGRAPVNAPATPPQPSVERPFLNDVQQLVAGGTITAAEGRVVDGEIQAGRVDTDTLAASGFTPTQLQAVQAALTTTKRGLAAAAHATSK
jgi:hypothetical protein